MDTFFYSFLFTITKGHIVCVVTLICPHEICEVNAPTSLVPTKREEEQYLFL